MNRPWWEDAVFYHVYLPSFMDASGDGFGDLAGLTSRVPYLASLGVDAVWVSPFFRSRMEDFGYDVTGYTEVDPAFGTLDDFDALVGALHAAGIKLVLDLVVNHTSRHHEWFVDAASSRDSAHRDWYVWREPRADGSPPNNWRSINAPDVPGSAWQWQDGTQQYLLCTFSLTQPDLNWTNPAVVDEVAGIVRFWLARGADGFRLDMIDFVGKHPDLADEPELDPASDYFSSSTMQLHLGTTLKHLARLRDVMDEFPDRVAIGEVGGLMPLERLVALHGDGRGLHLPHNFRLVFLPWQATPLRAFIAAYDDAIGEHGWPNYVLTNHDLPRVSVHGEATARLAMMLLLTLRGTPFIYYGEELAMTNASIPLALQRDPWRTPETGLGRDPSRTPMQWDGTRMAGFTTGRPWLPVTADSVRLNVDAESSDPHSMLELTRALLRTRRQIPSLREGELWWIDEGDDPGVLAFGRGHDVRVVLNFGAHSHRFTLPRESGWMISTFDPRPVVFVGEAILAPGEGRLFVLE